MNKVCCYRKQLFQGGFLVDHLVISVVVPPPTLPPIPAIATGSASTPDPWEGDYFSSSALGGGDTSTTSTTISATTRTRTPPTAMGLSDHPLPSPILRDLHSWMGVGESGPTVSGGANRSHATITNNSNFNTSIIVNPIITDSSNVAGTSNNGASTAPRASSPSTSTTSTSTVRPSSVSGGFAGFGGLASEVPGLSRSAYQGPSIFGGGNSGRSGVADELRLTDPRVTGEMGHGGDGLPMFGGFTAVFLLVS